jgi:5-methylcytosine-specific restriction endonuclease McrBC regulatory subunit McrC
LLRQYRTYRNNDWNFKGRLDVSRHIRENVPLPHGIAYVKREIDLDVPVNRMLLLASQVVQRRRPDLFDNNEDATDAFRILRTGIADPGDIRTVLSCRDCRESISHPFYRETWEPLRQIARMILEEEKWQIFQEDAEEEVSGVVFDGAWLWEEYLATVLAECGYRHCVRNQQSENDKFESLKNEHNSNNVAPMYPDFVRKDGDRYVALADAKYKRFLTRDDRLQMIAYSFIYDTKVVSIIYPPEDVNCEDKKEPGDEESVIDDESIDNNQRRQGWFNIRSVSSQTADKTTNKYLRIFSLGKITTRDSFEDFAGVMHERECRLRRMLQETAPEL